MKERCLGRPYRQLCVSCAPNNILRPLFRCFYHSCLLPKCIHNDAVVSPYHVCCRCQIRAWFILLLVTCRNSNKNKMSFHVVGGLPYMWDLSPYEIREYVVIGHSDNKLKSERTALRAARALHKRRTPCYESIHQQHCRLNFCIKFVGKTKTSLLCIYNFATNHAIIMQRITANFAQLYLSHTVTYPSRRSGSGHM